MSVDIPVHLKDYFLKGIEKHELLMVDYSLDFKDRKYSEKIVKLYKRRVRKINKQQAKAI